MKNALRELVLSIGPKILPRHTFLEKLLSISLLTRNYAAILSTNSYAGREELWRAGVQLLKDDEVTYLEFGVWKGESVSRISRLIANPKARFFGFDSFFGLPEKWDAMTQTGDIGQFSVDGVLPKIEDPRVSFIKGWFQNTVPEFISDIKGSLHGRLIVHYDADLYSSTLLCLMHVDTLKTRYLAVFDEFAGHETRALYNYQQATGAKVEFIGRAGPSKRYPYQVLAWITPQVYFDIS